jgi:hypothetical protein
MLSSYFLVRVQWLVGPYKGQTTESYFFEPEKPGAVVVDRWRFGIIPASVYRVVSCKRAIEDRPHVPFRLTRNTSRAVASVQSASRAIRALEG